MKFILLSFLIYFCFLHESLGQEKISSTEFSWKEASIDSNQPYAKELLEYTFNSFKKWQSNVLLIIKNDQIILEKYANGFTPEKSHRLWSMTKSFTNALIGQRIAEKKISLEKPVATYYPGLNNEKQKDITIRHLLEMASGLKWNEFYEANPFTSDVVDMLYIENFKDMALFTASHAQSHRAGTHFNYSSGETNLLMGVLKKTFDSKQEYDEYPWKNLFKPLGIKSATWERDQAGQFVGSSYLFMTPRDLARFGRLFLNEGLWNQKMILPRDWIKTSITPNKASCQTSKKGMLKGFSYGLHWWLNQKCPEKNSNFFPQIPMSTYFALGHHGQIMAIFPEQKSMAIRLGADKKERFNRAEWLRLVFQLIKN